MHLKRVACKGMSSKIVVALFGVVSLAIPLSFAADNAGVSDEQHWVGTWSAAPESIVGSSSYVDQTLRLIVHTSIGGNRVRVRISNTFSTESLLIGTAHIALRKAGAEIIASSDRPLSFGGKASFTVPAGALVLSDPVDLDVPSQADLAVSIYLPAFSLANTTHLVAQQTNYVAQMPGDFTSATNFPGAGTTFEWDFLTGVDVVRRHGAAAVVLGDSVTDGIGSTPDTDRRWPDFLARRLQAQNGLRHLAVLNEGNTGNRILYPAPPQSDFFGAAALARFDRDVLGQAGVKYLIVLLGTNDIAQPGIVTPDSEEVSANDIIAGHLQLIARAHERGVLAFGCTLLPFKNSLIAPEFYTPEKNAKREAVNEWIRSSGAYDAVIDFDKAVRDPAHPLQVLPAYDSGDHTHLNDAGYRAMANAIDLNLFRGEDSW